MKKKILGLSFSSDKSSLPMVLIHTQKSGGTLVNGKKAKIVVAPPQHKLHEACKENSLVIKLPDNVFPLRENDFISFNKGGVLLRVSEGNGTCCVCEVAKEGFLLVSESFEKWEPVNVAVLTVSDKGSRGEREDTSGPALGEAVVDIGGILQDRAIVPDEPKDILKVLRSWISRGYELILITGGTGLSPRDVTPESLADLEGKDGPGIGEYMRWRTSYYTLRSILSRCMAKVVERSLIIALPGSRKAALECFFAVSPVIRHAIEIVTGKATECAHNHK